MPMLEFRLASATGTRPVFVPGGFGHQAIRTLDDLAGHIARKHKISARTVWKWYSHFQKSSFTGLANIARADRGQSRYFTANPAAQALASKCLAEAMSLREIHEVLQRELDGNAPAYQTLRTYLHSISKPVRP